jgi:hypothetical protein
VYDWASRRQLRASLSVGVRCVEDASDSPRAATVTAPSSPAVAFTAVPTSTVAGSQSQGSDTSWSGEESEGGSFFSHSSDDSSYSSGEDP